MKIEKITDNKVKITVPLEELERRNITLHDIEINSSIAKDFFTDLIEESNIDDCFEFEDSQLFIEASADTNNTFILTVTKIEDIPDINSYNKKSNLSLCTRLDSQLFEFSSIDKILEFCRITKDEDLYFGKNSLYKYDNRYFILFNDSCIRNKKFLKTYTMLTEYSSRYFYNRKIRCHNKKFSFTKIKKNTIIRLTSGYFFRP